MTPNRRSCSSFINNKSERYCQCLFFLGVWAQSWDVYWVQTLPKWSRHTLPEVLQTLFLYLHYVSALLYFAKSIAYGMWCLNISHSISECLYVKRNKDRQSYSWETFYSFFVNSRYEGVLLVPGWSWQALDHWGPYMKLSLGGLLMLVLEWWALETGIFLTGKNVSDVWNIQEIDNNQGGFADGCSGE